MMVLPAAGSSALHQIRRPHPTLAQGTPASQEARPVNVNELPSVALTQRFLVLCKQYGSERLAAQVVAVGRSPGV